MQLFVGVCVVSLLVAGTLARPGRGGSSHGGGGGSSRGGGGGGGSSKGGHHPRHPPACEEYDPATDQVEVVGTCDEEYTFCDGKTKDEYDESGNLLTVTFCTPKPCKVVVTATGEVLRDDTCGRDQAACDGEAFDRDGSTYTLCPPPPERGGNGQAGNNGQGVTLREKEDPLAMLLRVLKKALGKKPNIAAARINPDCCYTQCDDDGNVLPDDEVETRFYQRRKGGRPGGRRPGRPGGGPPGGGRPGGRPGGDQSDEGSPEGLGDRPGGDGKGCKDRHPPPPQICKVESGDPKGVTFQKDCRNGNGCTTLTKDITNCLGEPVTATFCDLDDVKGPGPKGLCKIEYEDNSEVVGDCGSGKVCERGPFPSRFLDGSVIWETYCKGYPPCAVQKTDRSGTATREDLTPCESGDACPTVGGVEGHHRGEELFFCPGQEPPEPAGCEDDDN